MESLARRLVEVACERTATRHGAVFLWDAKAKGLVVDFHMVNGVIVALPGTGTVLKPRHDGRSNGIALSCFLNASPYLCNDTAKDPNYARYFLDVGSVLAVPIPWQGKPMGVLTVSSTEHDAFDYAHTFALEEVASISAKYLRRASLARQTRADGRPFVIKGLSPGWHEVERKLEQVSPTDAPVLVTGESGTGKDLVSRAIHFNSKRAGKPFVTVNCAAIPETMLESVLFGHVKGAFTGATFDKVGEFQKADGGTLFLDELGELPLMLQAKVLRAIEQGEVTPLGSNAAPGRVDVRFVCATNRNLPQMVKEGKFRDDLFFRVGVITVELPALRTYKDNLPILSQVFLQQSAQKHHRKVSAISPDAMAVLTAWDFPGNVRELKNSIEHAVIMARGETVQVEDLPKLMRGAPAKSGSPVQAVAVEAPVRTLAQWREVWVGPPEKRYLADLLQAHGGKVDAAAKVAGINRVTMYRLMQKHGLVVERRVKA
ncbi:MAG: sigma-54-dependent Fis family transcriptional regulator [Myxococcaceae bacterium]